MDIIEASIPWQAIAFSHRSSNSLIQIEPKVGVLPSVRVLFYSAYSLKAVELNFMRYELSRLVASDVISAEQLDRAVQASSNRGERVSAMLSQLGIIDDRTLADGFARAFDLPRFEARALPELFEDEISKSVEFLSSAGVWPLAINEHEALDIAVVDPTDVFSLTMIELKAGRPLALKIVTPDLIDQAVRALDPDSVEKTDSEQDVERLKDMASDAPVVRELDVILKRGAELGASDIHITPQENGLRLRYRVDGQLQNGVSPPDEMRPGLLSRLKILARLDIGETRLPQDGKFRSVARGKTIDFRLSTIPTALGEGAIIRLLDRSHVRLELDELGFKSEIVNDLRQLIDGSGGIVLVTGPTGSGKTSTLYALLNELNSDGRNIITVEDPVEHAMEGINQVQVKPEIGLDFARALRSILRQDPDILMVGEIRDGETARISAQAALTGHLVIATLHTNDAVTAAPRLIDMGVEPYLVGSVLRGVLAQRLLPTLCPHCKEVSEGGTMFLRERGISDRQAYDAHGCEQCHGNGRLGRVVVGEVLAVTPEIQAAIGSEIGADELRKYIKADQSIASDSLSHVAAGNVSIDDAIAAVRIV